MKRRSLWRISALGAVGVLSAHLTLSPGADSPLSGAWTATLQATSPARLTHTSGPPLLHPWATALPDVVHVAGITRIDLYGFAAHEVVRLVGVGWTAARSTCVTDNMGSCHGLGPLMITPPGEHTVVVLVGLRSGARTQVPLRVLH